LAARDRQRDRGAGVLARLILSSIVVGIALLTGWRAVKWSFATALLLSRAAGSRPTL
jgi:hypothetical protein